MKQKDRKDNESRCFQFSLKGPGRAKELVSILLFELLVKIFLAGVKLCLFGRTQMRRADSCVSLKSCFQSSVCRKGVVYMDLQMSYELRACCVSLRKTTWTILK